MQTGQKYRHLELQAYGVRRRCRGGAYAIRWESNDGRSGYMPKADRDWKSYLGAKDEDRKKVDRLTRKYRPLNDDVIRGHLVGEQTVGLYPLLLDETCWLLAVDFDKKTWQHDATAFLATCRENGVPALLERSRSGNGGHVWIFFERALPATTARKLGCVLLTRTMESRHQIGLDSYDRFFPNQDTMPKGGFCNLIALPLQKLPRANGKSVFVDEEFRPYPDQWEHLASVTRMRNAINGSWPMQIIDRECRESLVYPSHVSTWCMSKQKRCFDLVASVSGLILFSPIMLLIGCLIKVTSKGPVLFRQERIGLYQQPSLLQNPQQRLGRGVDFTRFERQSIADPSVGGRGKYHARCFWARRDGAG